MSRTHPPATAAASGLSAVTAEIVMLGPTSDLTRTRRGFYHRFLIVGRSGVLHGAILLASLAVAFLARMPIVAILFFFGANLALVSSSYVAWNRWRMAPAPIDVRPERRAAEEVRSED